MKYLIAIIIVLAIVSCKSGQVAVTFKNSSGETFKNFEANIRGKKFSFIDFESGQKKTVRVPETYQYFPLLIITATDTLRMQPIDYVGEHLATSGKIIMELSIVKNDNGTRRLQLKTKKKGTAQL
jgi:hypothetical protein